MFELLAGEPDALELLERGRDAPFDSGEETDADGWLGPFEPLEALGDVWYGPVDVPAEELVDDPLPATILRGAKRMTTAKPPLWVGYIVVVDVTDPDHVLVDVMNGPLYVGDGTATITVVMLSEPLGGMTLVVVDDPAYVDVIVITPDVTLAGVLAGVL